MKRVFPTLCLAAALTSCAISKKQGPIHEADYSEPIRLACVGDSITYGYGISGRETNSYPSQLQKLLGDRWDVQNFGVNGATALRKGTRPYNEQPSFSKALSFKPNVVVIKLGTNDTNAKSWPDHKEEFLSDYLELIRSFQNLETRPRIFICRPVPLFRDRGKAYDTDKILTEEVIPKITEAAKKSRLPLIDLYTLFEGKAQMFPDGVHPDANGAREMANLICAKLSSKPAGQKTK
jgi:lysophospholipase L1-like esterase